MRPVIKKYSMNKAIKLILNKKLKEMEDWRTLNTVFMLGTTVGNKLSESYFGTDIVDASQIKHSKIGNTVLPILEIKESNIIEFYKQCKEKEKNEDFEAIDFTLTAQNSNEYSRYAEKLSKEKIEEQLILGIALFGDQKEVKSLCGSLSRWE